MKIYEMLAKTNGVNNTYLVRKIISNHSIFKWSLPELSSQKHNEVTMFYPKLIETPVKRVKMARFYRSKEIYGENLQPS